MCNNNGTCRKSNPGVMCPSYRATKDEQHVTRGRANSLRLALTGQLGADAFTSDAMYDTMDLCVGCKGCKRECPTGVDMARMKTEFLYHYRKRHGLRLKDRLIAYLPRYAPLATALAPLLNLRNRIPALAWLQDKALGISAQRALPEWRADAFRDVEVPAPQGEGRDVVLLADTFNRWYEPENLRAALAVLGAGGYRVHLAQAPAGERALCCGRTFLAAGLVDEARAEAQRMIDALLPHARLGRPIIGLEPSCLFTLRDEFKVLLPGGHTDTIALRAVLIEEFLAAEADAGRLDLPLHALPQRQALLHGHCHQKAFATMGAVEQALRLIPELDVRTVASSCCGMAGAFGYETEHYEVSMEMAELDLLPAVRAADADTLLVADGTSCRHQIAAGTGRAARHVVQALAAAVHAPA
jgi:Fe-S oxidoreductase